MKQIIVGFEIDIDSNISHKELTDRQKHELALYDENAIIYDCPKDFFDDMNNDMVDTENRLWYLIDID
jgi:hypothetical protein